MHDISCIGRCSLTVALPILSVAGVETCVLPTAILSTHTGEFTGFTHLDLTDEMGKITAHWKTLDHPFDAIYSGYLGSIKQLELVEQFITSFRNENTLVIIDPVMGDDGKLYALFTHDFVDGMRNLCKKADVIVPNMTEAAFLLGREYNGGIHTEDEIRAIVKDLSSLSKNVVLTGVYFDEDHYGAAVYSDKTGEISFALAPKVHGYFHGTGDVFASALTGAILNGLPLKEAADVAVSFTSDALNRTNAEETPLRFGVDFENALPLYMKLLHRI